MWEMIKNMKVLYLEKIYPVYDINFITGTLGMVEDMDSKSRCSTPIDNTIPLYTFPEKDEEGSMVWSGDMIIICDDVPYALVAVIFNGKEWVNYEFTEEGKWVLGDITVDEWQDIHFVRLCSIFDSDCQEKTNLALEEINRLKQIMIGE
jgi:hypothetical protein